MYSARRAVGWVSVFYFISLVVFGMMIVMSLFLAILLSHFSTPEQDLVDLKKEEEKQRQLELQRRLAQAREQGFIGANRAKHAEEQERIRRREAGESSDSDDGTLSNASQMEGLVGGLKLRSNDDVDDEDDSPVTAAGRALSRAYSAASAAPWSSVGGGRFDNDDDNYDTGRERAWYAQQQQQTPRNNSVETAEEGAEGMAIANGGADGKEGTGPLGRAGATIAGWFSDAARSVRVPEHIYPGFALCCLSAKNPLRRGCAAIVSSSWFGRFITLLIVVSSIILAIDSPLRDPDSTTGRALEVVELVTTILFTVEFLLKVCASGFLFMPMAYLRDPWNVLDFVVVFASVSQLFVASGPRLVGLRSLRALRALRPLR